MSFTAIVVTHNDAQHLHECLTGLKFCDQVLIFDLQSSDKSVEIAQRFNTEIRQRDKVPVVELLMPEAVNFARNDWLVIIDPDEVFPQSILSKIDVIRHTNLDTGIIRIPWQFFFKGKKLITTIWGGAKKTKPIIFHKERVDFTGIVHQGITLKDGFSSFTIVAEADEDFIKHYWVDSFQQLLEKHLRYIGQEGKSRYEDGERFSIQKMVREVSRSLYTNLIKFFGWRGGFTGIFLSFFNAWYVFMSCLSLRKYQNSLQQ